MKKITISIPDKMYEKVKRMSAMKFISNQKYCRHALQMYIGYDEKRTMEWLEELARKGKDAKKKQEAGEDPGSVSPDVPAV